MNACKKYFYDRGKVIFCYYISHLLLSEPVAREYQENIKLASIPRRVVYKREQDASHILTFRRDKPFPEVHNNSS